MTQSIFTPIPADTARPIRYRGPISEVWRWLYAAYLGIAGWHMEGDWPLDEEKLVVLAAPHTSNWDGINMLAAAGYYRIRLKWMGKKSLTTGPFGAIVKWLGCVPVDRSSSNDLVAQMAEAFASADNMNLAIPPEGTRARTDAWKSGFYQIAVAAKVPVLITVLDYGSRKIRLAALMRPAGDYDGDLHAILSAYKDASGKHVERFVLPAPPPQ